MTISKKSKRLSHAQQTEKHAERIAEITLLEDKWLQDRALGDARSSESLLDEAYRGGDSDGLVVSRSEFLAAIRSLSSEGAQVEHADRHIQCIGDVVLSQGIATIHHDGARASFRYLRAFVYRDGNLRLIASQSTRIGQVK